MFEKIDEGIIKIGRDYYVTSQKALNSLLARARKVGYEVKGLRNSSSRKMNDCSVEYMEQNGRPLWRANLNVKRYKCKACHNYINQPDLTMDRQECEYCEKLIHYHVLYDNGDLDYHHLNFDIVLEWKGTEYSEYCTNFPIPQSFSIYETWYWAPLESSPTLHEKVLSSVGAISNKGWYAQDGRQFFTQKSMEQMGKFVRYFTKLNADAWDEKSRHFRLDGPGGVDDVANFCHPNSKINETPNIINELVYLSDAQKSKLG